MGVPDMNLLHECAIPALIGFSLAGSLLGQSGPGETIASEFPFFSASPGSVTDAKERSRTSLMSEVRGVTSWFGVPGEAHCVVSGMNGARGSLQHFTSYASSLVLRSSAAAQGELGSCAYDVVAGRLFVVDVSNNSILSAPWDGSGALATLSWTTLVDLAGLPPPPEPWGADEIGIALVGGGDRESPIYTATALKLFLRGYVPHFVVPQAAPMWCLVDIATRVAEVPDPAIDLNGDAFVLRDYVFKEGGTEVEVSVAYGNTHSFTLCDPSTGVVLGTALQESPRASIIVQSDEVFVVGSRYEVRRDDVAGPGHVQECIVQYGRPQQTAENRLQIGRLWLSGSLALASDSYTVGARIETTSTVSLPTEIEAVVGVALRGPDGSDPVVHVDASTSVLLADGLLAVVSAPFVITGDVYFNAMAEPFLVPSDPAMIGEVLLFQLFLEDAGTWHVSDVLGSAITANGVATASRRLPGASFAGSAERRSTPPSPGLLESWIHDPGLIAEVLADQIGVLPPAADSPQGR
jgi:hypothetical protein